MKLVLSSSILGILGIALIASGDLAAQDIHLHLPKRSSPTPVQNYNREGVSALDKHDYQKAKKLFYKAYLLDPNDPFTLNNLGYVAELEGDVDRAQRFYDLSAAMNSDAAVDKSTGQEAKGKPVKQVAGHFQEGPLQANRLNLEAMSFLIKGRPYEAEKILNKALAQDPKNPFTLNNLGYDMEQQGELKKAIEYYDQSAALQSDESVIVAVNKNWRGKPISEVAAENSRRVNQAIESNNTPEAQVAALNLRGVSALNRNDHKTAREDFEQAYKQDPNNAFALNNMGYLAELDGDRETAQIYYEKAKVAERANRPVTVASDPRVEGKRLGTVASNSDQLVDARMAALRTARRNMPGGVGNINLENRGFSQTPPPAEENASAPPPQPEGPVSAPVTTPQPVQTQPTQTQPMQTQPAQTQPAQIPSVPAQTNPTVTPSVQPQAQPSKPQEKDPVPVPK